MLRKGRQLDEPPLVRKAKRFGPWTIVLALAIGVSTEMVSWSMLKWVVVILVLALVVRKIWIHRHFRGDKKKGSCGVKGCKYSTCSRYEKPTSMGTCGYREEGGFCRLLNHVRKRRISHRRLSAPTRRGRVRQFR